MPRKCEPFTLPPTKSFPGGVFGFICYTESKRKSCVVCGKPSTKLCDFPVDELGKTCDAPLCDKHAFHPLVNGVPMFGENKDYCPSHAVDAVEMFMKGGAANV